MKEILVSISFIVLLFCISCGNQERPESNNNHLFLHLRGVQMVDSVYNVYEYKDSLFYYDKDSEMLFNIPKNYLYSKDGVYWEHGITLFSPDSTIIISLNSQVDSWGRYIKDLEIDYDNNIFPMWAYCYDNSDWKIFVEEDATGYTKIGFDKDYKSLYEQGFLYYTERSGYLPHIIRIEYPNHAVDSVLEIIWQIESYPNFTNLNQALK